MPFSKEVRNGINLCCSKVRYQLWRFWLLPAMAPSGRSASDIMIMGLFSHYHDSPVIVWKFDIVSITLSSPHQWVAPDQSPGSLGRSLHWLPCLKASGLCDHNVIIVMMAIDKQRPPVYNPCRMNILKASHNLVDDELHLKIIHWEVFLLL